jgi:hypothetical protein
MKNEKNEKSDESKNKLLITISQENDNDELFNILNGTNKLPFNLPNHVVFPSGKKEFARRARMLMLAGMDFLKEKYPEVQLNEKLDGKMSINKNKKNEEKENNIATF